MNKSRTTLALLAAGLLAPCISPAAPLPSEPLGGKPPAGSAASVTDLDYQVKYQRAFESVLWSMPAVGMYAYWHAAADWDAGSNAIIAWSKLAPPFLEGVTGNNQTPYLLSQTDLSKGPVVLEVPAATEKATIQKAYDNLDFARGVEVYLNALPGVSLYANRSRTGSKPFPAGAGARSCVSTARCTGRDRTGRLIVNEKF